MSMPVIRSVYVGRPKTMKDHRGEWTSSIARQLASGPVKVFKDGLADDKVAQPYHGGPEAALCVHLCDHYRFWNDRYNLNLQEGGLGENLVLDGIAEEEVHIGDIVQIGTAVVQVSGPRVPCSNQARHVGRPEWVRLTIKENRTGFYLRVLEEGAITAGDHWRSRERLNENASITTLNECFYLKFDPVIAERFAGITGLADWWKQQFREKLRARAGHWSESITQ